MSKTILFGHFYPSIERIKNTVNTRECVFNYVTNGVSVLFKIKFCSNCSANPVETFIKKSSAFSLIT